MKRPRKSDQKTTSTDFRGCRVHFTCLQPFKRNLCLCSPITNALKMFFLYMKTALRFHISQESVGETSLNPGSHIGTTLCCEAIRALNNLTLISI